MHEHSFIQAIINNVDDSNNVNSIVIEVGELAGIEPDHLIDHLKKETSWDIKTVSKEAKVSCDCGFVGKPKILQRLHDLVIFDCPKCHKMPDILEGKDIKILSVTYN